MKRLGLLAVLFMAPGCAILLVSDTPPFYRVQPLPTPERIGLATERVDSFRLLGITASRGFDSALVKVTIEPEEDITIEPARCALFTEGNGSFSVMPAVTEVRTNGEVRVLASEKVSESHFVQDAYSRIGWVKCWQKLEPFGALRLPRNARTTLSFIFPLPGLENPEFLLTIHADESDLEYCVHYRIPTGRKRGTH